MLDQSARDMKTSAGSASTNNWDTVFAIEFADVNRAIAASGNYATSFDVSQTSGGETAHLFGTFDAWRMTGGADQNIIMTLPIPTFTLEFTGDDDKSRENAWLRIQVALDRIPRKSNGDKGTTIDFRTALRSNTGTDIVKIDSFGWPGSDDPTDPNYDSDLVEDVKILLADWFRQEENLEQFDHTFCTVNLNARAAKEAFQWLMPTTATYAVKELADDRVGAFGVLCMTENRDAPENQTLNINILQDGKAGLLINKDRFLEKFIKPGLSALFTTPADDPNWVDDHFGLSESGTSITNTKAVHIDDFSLRENEYVRADVPEGGFTATLEDTFLEITYNDLNHPYYHVVDYWYTARHTLSVTSQAGMDEDGAFILIPGRDEKGDEIMDHAVRLEKGTAARVVDWGLLALDIIAVVGTIAKGVSVARAAANANPVNPEVVAQVVGTGADAAVAAEGWLQAGIRTIREGATAFGAWVRVHPAFIWGNIALLITGLAGQQLKNYLEEQTEENPERVKPDMNEFALQIMAPVQWPGDTGFDVSSVAFNGGFHIVGNANFNS